MVTSVPPPLDTSLARQVREQFVAHIAGVLSGMSTAIAERLVVLTDQSESTKESHRRRDALLAFQSLSREWTQGTVTAWRKTLTAPKKMPREPMNSTTLELIGTDAVENKILASRLALNMMDKTGMALNELRLRIQKLESTRELASYDVLRPEVTAQLLIDQWTHAGLERFIWVLVQDVVQQHMLETLSEAYKQANQFLISKGVLPEIDLKSQIRFSAPSTINAGFGPDSVNGGLYSGSESKGRGHVYASSGGQDNATTSNSRGRQSDDDTTTPIGRARMRAQGLLGQLKRALGDRAQDYVATQPQDPSPGLVKAINQSSADDIQQRAALGEDADNIVMENVAEGVGAGVARTADNLRERSASIKKQATTSGEKAIIEIVALMFQSILAEERIPASVRVWFARLQMPVMRVALFEPEFFNTLHHPARKLIDHMGSCVLGFDSRAISGSALESEIKRVVQVIEQYPDTGRRVFQLVYDEFQKFLSKYLTEKGTSQRVVTLAQQVEQKETLAIQYTIEMRNMLNSMPVREEIREFLFKVWAEVLAVAAIKNGPQHDETIMLKRAASDLVWAASAKPNRTDRAQVIHDLPALLQGLRQGMALLGFTGEQQETHIKIIGDTLADAFMSKTESIPQERIDAMAERLAHLEDFIIQDGAGDIPLDAASIEMLVGIDTSAIMVVADGGSKPTQAMLAWAQELQPGTWYTIDHSNKSAQVQFVWRSERKQLHLFAAVDGSCYLIQARRLAAYLQAGLLVPHEEEALTVRATRSALEKLDANPERLLS